MGFNDPNLGITRIIRDIKLSCGVLSSLCCNGITNMFKYISNCPCSSLSMKSGDNTKDVCIWWWKHLQLVYLCESGMHRKVFICWFKILSLPPSWCYSQFALTFKFEKDYDRFPFQAHFGKYVFIKCEE
jgi:hypothetical protein